MSAFLKWLGERVLFVALGFASAWFIQHYRFETYLAEAESWPDTTSHQTPVVNIPPAVVKPNPAPARPRTDLTDGRRVDSLITICNGKDSLRTVADSVISELSITRFVSQTFRAQKDSVFVIGHMDILYFPLDQYFMTEAFVDSLSVPLSVINTQKIVRITETDWGWTFAGVAVGFVVGGLVVWELAR